jgi:hypothetical protein
MFVAATLLAVIAVRATDQDAQLQYSVLPSLVNHPGNQADPFWGRFMASCDRNLNGLFADQFNSLQVMNWNMSLNSHCPTPVYTCAANAAGHAFSQAVVYGARESTVDLPVMEWLADHQNWLADFVRNSLGSVEEEAVAPAQLSYRPVEQSWWRRLSNSDNLCYGLRPFKTNPYAFLSWAIRDGNQMILLSNLRYHYENFADHNFEFAMSIPLANRCALNLGTSYQFGRHEEQKRLTIRFSKVLFLGGILNVGFEVQQHPRLLVGLATPW